MSHPASDTFTITRSGMRQVRVGFIALTDCASLVVAATSGFDRRHGIEIVLQRQASWAAVRDKLMCGELDASQALYGQVFGIHCGSGGLQHDMAILMALSQNGQAITLSNALRADGITDGNALARRLRQGRHCPIFAQTYPTGTHALWLYYWLAAHGVDPLHDIRRIVVPPPDMVSNLRAGRMDGFCAGEPWNQKAVLDEVGFTVATSQQIWPDHPEKVLASTATFADQHPDTARALICAVLEASRWLDASHANRKLAADILAAPAFLDMPADTIRGRMLGEYHDGLGRHWQDAHPLRFFGDGEVNFPWHSDGLWFLAQLQRWGLLGALDHTQVVRAVNRHELYAEAAAALRLDVPASLMRRSLLMDGEIWDGSRANRYAPASL